ncbi:isochorismatase family protein, partial [Bacillus thuringiensis]|uniref:isochorismatase family protein n=1 Tax=Bacillus thuringiensis TaxID=1428 RepID=UPI0011A5EDBA
ASLLLGDIIGVEIYDDVEVIGKERVIEKDDGKSFLRRNLLERLQREKIEGLVIWGMMSDVCIDGRVGGGSDLGFECIAIE